MQRKRLAKINSRANRLTLRKSRTCGTTDEVKKRLALFSRKKGT